MNLYSIAIHLGNNNNYKYCYCPCCKQNAKWRKQHGLDELIDDGGVICKSTDFIPIGIMDHLRTIGGVYEEKKDRRVSKIPMKCRYHYGARLFMEYLYKDYNGGECLLCLHSLHLLN